MSSFEILRADDADHRSRWIQLWSSWPEREVSAHPAYVDLFAAPGDRVLAASFTTADGGVLYPLIQRRIDGSDRFDVTSPYGYGGPFAWGTPSAGTFWTAYDAWARDEQIVSEFVRLAVGQVQLLPFPVAAIHRAENVVIPTSVPEETLWRAHEHKVRKNVAKARRSNVTIEVDETGARFEDFLRIYTSTLTRRSARGSYYFTTEFFARIHASLSGQFVYFHALHDGAVVSTELALLSKTRMYSFLGGTDEGAFHLRPNDLLKHEMIQWARSQGIQEFVLGGGYEPDDGIFRYKRDFYPEGVVPFLTGQRIHDGTAYEALSRARLSTHADLTRFFPAYRAPLTESTT